ncbi:MAG: glycine cleavage system protein GcvH [Calditrichaeota bacterium]|nr:MAG: glycine cleavage system protein GcvH [Calditrichota bacterium]MBL1207381.1 glycine cleavage system protein GcvH [Calditrichota bacterium]NOG47213.1 glycine cleavage system protein GcvH [Calditrichota bacterium]
MNIPSELKYTKDHEWAKLEGDIVTVGITDYAQGELGDVVFVELPAAGDEVSQDETFGTIEAVKAVADLFSPLTGEVVEINEALTDQPDIVNSDPYGEGWMAKIKIPDESEWNALMSDEDYKNLIG